MKKIAFVVDFFPTPYGPYIINQILNALNAGYEIAIFPGILNEAHDSCQPEIIKHYGIMDKIIKPVPRYSSKLKYLKWLLKTLLSGPRDLVPYFIKSLNPFLFGKGVVKLFIFRRVVQFYGNSDFDIYHCQFGPNGLIAAGLKELGLIDGKIITTFHGWDAHIKDPFFKSYRTSIRAWSTLLFKHSDLVTANTPYLLKQVIDLGADPDKAELMPMGVDTSIFLPKECYPKKQKIQLLSVGRLRKWKGHELGIQAVDKLVKEGLNLEYFIIGDGPERVNLQRLIEKLHLNKHVKMLGKKKQSEVKKWMQESDVYLMTSVYDDTGRRETQGVVTAEAQACGLPVVAFRSGGVPYTLEEGKTGYMAEEKNLTEYTQHLRKLCTDEKLRKKMGKNARKFIEDSFCQTKVAQKQVSLYEKVLLDTSN